MTSVSIPNSSPLTHHTIPAATEICLRVGSLTLSEHTPPSWSGKVPESRQPASGFRHVRFIGSSRKACC